MININDNFYNYDLSHHFRSKMAEKRPPKSVSQKCKEYRARKVAGDPDYLKRERERIQSHRVEQKQAETEAAAIERRQKEKDRKRKYRSERKMGDKTSTTPENKKPYERPQSYGKALNRVLRALPASPQKKHAVVCGLAKRVGVQLEDKMNVSLGNHGRALDDEMQTAVINFYYRPDIVYTMPGMKDEMVVWDKEGNKERKRKYFLTMFLREAYAIYSSEQSESVSFSKFAKLRPQNVLLLKNSPPDQCKCLVHENLRQRLLGLNISYDSSTFVPSIICDANPNSKCWRQECEICADGKLLQLPATVDPDDSVRWKEWEYEDKLGTNDVVRKILVCNVKEATAKKLLMMLKENMRHTITHVNTKRIQAQDFEDDKIDDEARILQIDFAMNYSCEYQNEVQSALWSRGSVMLFTAAVTYKDTCKTYLICSNSCDKGKNTIAVFLSTLYELIENDGHGPLHEIIWSDGPSSEFKNRFMVHLLQYLSRKYNKPFTWKYFATSHGKGVVDGVGGRAKSIVRMAVMSKGSESPVVQNSADFVKVASGLLDKTTVIHVPQSEIDLRLAEMNVDWNDAPVVPGIQKIHIISVEQQDNEIKCWPNALAKRTGQLVEPIPDDSEQITSEMSQELDIVMGDWCLVQYEGEEFPGEVRDVLEGSEYKVSVMHPAGGCFKWPNEVDCIVYPKTSILRKVAPPIPVGTRGQFTFKL